MGGTLISPIENYVCQLSNVRRVEQLMEVVKKLKNQSLLEALGQNIIDINCMLINTQDDPIY